MIVLKYGGLMKQKNKSKSRRKKKLIIITTIILAIIVLVVVAWEGYIYYLENISIHRFEIIDESSCTGGFCPALKPIIYLYPKQSQDVKVELDYDGQLTSTYPDYNYSLKGWEVTANPDGSLTDHKDNKEYSYLFWEGKGKVDYSNFKDGFVVKGEDTKKFLQAALSKIGLTAKEYNEMIVYWLPCLG